MWATFIVTAYCACVLCTGHTHGITKSGVRAQSGTTVACEPKLLGRSVYIAGIGKRACQDIGSKVGHRRIDLYVDTHAEAVQFGRHIMKVRVLR